MLWRDGPAPKGASLEAISALIAAEYQISLLHNGSEVTQSWLDGQISKVADAYGVTVAPGFLDQQLRRLDEA